MEVRGLIPATVTPFRADSSIDYDDLARHIAQVASADGLFGVAVNGHQGEVQALSGEERVSVIHAARSVLPGHLKLVAGVEACTVDGLVRDGINARKAGADLLLVLPPFDVSPFRRLTQYPEAVYPVFERLDREVGLPMILFQYPRSRGCAYTLEVLSCLAEFPSVVGIKAAADTVTSYAEMYDSLHGRMAVLAASDAPSLLGMLLYGAEGALIGISVVGTPIWAELVKEATVGSASRAKEVFHSACVPLLRDIFENQEPKTPVSPQASTKEALVQLGQLRCAHVRAPAIGPDEKRKAAIARALIEAGLRASAETSGGGSSGR